MATSITWSPASDMDWWGDVEGVSDHYWVIGPESDGTWSASYVQPLYDEHDNLYDNDWSDVGIKGYPDATSVRRAVMEYERNHDKEDN